MKLDPKALKAAAEPLKPHFFRDLGLADEAAREVVTAYLEAVGGRAPDWCEGEPPEYPATVKIHLPDGSVSETLTGKVRPNSDKRLSGESLPESEREPDPMEFAKWIEAHYAEDVPGYESLRRVLQEAYDQSARGKGKERHGNGLPFDKQPIMNIARMVGLGGHTYQISKKAQEATSMAAREAYPAAKAEILGIIVYAAAAYLLIEEKESS